jgi:UDP-N-acetylmuramate--alanine ligase
MVGIGGIGMSSIAEVLLMRGYAVTGSDLEPGEITERLERLGATIHSGHDAGHVGDADVVVYSSAVDPGTNPETLDATARRIPIVKRSVMLGELMRMKYGVAIAGTHGKTTTTSLVGSVTAEAGFDPTVVLGGKVASFGSNAVVGEGDIIVIEADEYDRTFLRLTPSLAVVTNVDVDHLDTYRDEEDIRSAFVDFAHKVPFFGAVIACIDDPGVQRILPKIDRPVVTYGTSRQAEVRAEDVRQDGLEMHFRVVRGSTGLGEVRINIPGTHNVRNALAAIAVGLELDVPFDRIRTGLGSVSGVRRRFEMMGTVGDVCVIDAYAHHPAELSATLETAAGAWPGRRLVAAFQPHLYSRTEAFRESFARAFLLADAVFVTGVYGAREAVRSDVDGSELAMLAERYGHRQVRHVPEVDDLATELARFVEPGDIVLMIGAGSIWRQTAPLLEHLETRHHLAEVAKTLTN